MSDSIPWPRFLITAFIVAIATFVFDLFLHGTLIPALFADYPPADYPSRPAAELQALYFDVVKGKVPRYERWLTRFETSPAPARVAVG